MTHIIIGGLNHDDPNDEHLQAALVNRAVEQDNDSEINEWIFAGRINLDSMILFYDLSLDSVNRRLVKGDFTSNIIGSRECNIMIRMDDDDKVEAINFIPVSGSFLSSGIMNGIGDMTTVHHVGAVGIIKQKVPDVKWRLHSSLVDETSITIFNDRQTEIYGVGFSITSEDFPCFRFGFQMEDGQIKNFLIERTKG